MQNDKKTTVRIMSYNIWGNCAKDKPIADRGKHAADIILRYLPDSVGLQECSPKSREQNPNICDYIAEKYTEIPVTPTNTNNNNYTPVFYNKATIKPLDFGYFFYEGLNDKGSKSVTWVVYECIATGEKFIHFNTHYYWTGDEPGRLARIQNTKDMLLLFDEIKEKYPSVPAFFTGDFNCRSYEPPIEALYAFGLKEARDAAKVGSPYRSHHAYPSYNEESNTYYNGITPNLEPAESIDHIFAYGDTEIETYVTVIDTEALLSSDHCPIYSDFII